jgi:hypothetical protein
MMTKICSKPLVINKDLELEHSKEDPNSSNWFNYHYKLKVTLNIVFFFFKEIFLISLSSQIDGN